jgi:hypothetical protein
MEGALECLGESENTLRLPAVTSSFVLVFMCRRYQCVSLVFDPNAADVSCTLDRLSIDPAKWFALLSHRVTWVQERGAEMLL